MAESLIAAPSASIKWNVSRMKGRGRSYWASTRAILSRLSGVSRTVIALSDAVNTPLALGRSTYTCGATIGIASGPRRYLSAKVRVSRLGPQDEQAVSSATMAVGNDRIALTVDPLGRTR